MDTANLLKPLNHITPFHFLSRALPFRSSHFAHFKLKLKHKHFHLSLSSPTFCSLCNLSLSLSLSLSFFLYICAPMYVYMYVYLYILLLIKLGVVLYVLLWWCSGERKWEFFTLWDWWGSEPCFNKKASSSCIGFTSGTQKELPMGTC